MEATTTRASIVIKSIPTSEILTHASMTIPLSNTRSRTSIRLVPPGVLSTAICFGSFLESLENRAHCARIDGAHCSFKHLSHANENLPIATPGFRLAFTLTFVCELILFTTSSSQTCGCELSNFLFQLRKPFTQLNVLGFRTFGPGRQVCVVSPPVQTDLLCFIDRANEQTDLQRRSEEHTSEL